MRLHRQGSRRNPPDCAPCIPHAWVHPPSPRTMRAQIPSSGDDRAWLKRDAVQDTPASRTHTATTGWNPPARPVSCVRDPPIPPAKGMRIVHEADRRSDPGGFFPARAPIGDGHGGSTPRNATRCGARRCARGLHGARTNEPGKSRTAHAPCGLAPRGSPADAWPHAVVRGGSAGPAVAPARALRRDSRNAVSP